MSAEFHDKLAEEAATDMLAYRLQHLHTQLQLIRKCLDLNVKDDYNATVEERMQDAAALATEACKIIEGEMPPFSSVEVTVEESGPWSVQEHNGVWYLQSDDFHTDAQLRISGDFYNGPAEYARMIASRLNGQLLTSKMQNAVIIVDDVPYKIACEPGTIEAISTMICQLYTYRARVGFLNYEPLSVF